MLETFVEKVCHLHVKGGGSYFSQNKKFSQIYHFMYKMKRRKMKFGAYSSIFENVN